MKFNLYKWYFISVLRGSVIVDSDIYSLRAVSAQNIYFTIRSGVPIRPITYEDLNTKKIIIRYII